MRFVGNDNVINTYNYGISHHTGESVSYKTEQDLIDTIYNEMSWRPEYAENIAEIIINNKIVSFRRIVRIKFMNFGPQEAITMPPYGRYKLKNCLNDDLVVLDDPDNDCKTFTDTKSLAKYVIQYMDNIKYVYIDGEIMDYLLYEVIKIYRPDDEDIEIEVESDGLY